MKLVNLLLSEWVGLSPALFLEILFMQDTMILEFPASHCHLAKGSHKYTCCIFFKFKGVVTTSFPPPLGKTWYKKGLIGKTRVKGNPLFLNSLDNYLRTYAT